MFQADTWLLALGGIERHYRSTGFECLYSEKTERKGKEPSTSMEEKKERKKIK